MESQGNLARIHKEARNFST